jgi:hypothetical protein
VSLRRALGTRNLTVDMRWTQHGAFFAGECDLRKDRERALAPAFVMLAFPIRKDYF